MRLCNEVITVVHRGHFQVYAKLVTTSRKGVDASAIHTAITYNKSSQVCIFTQEQNQKHADQIQSTTQEHPI